MRCIHCNELIYLPLVTPIVWLHANGKAECKGKDTKAEPQS